MKEKCQFFPILNREKEIAKIEVIVSAEKMSSAQMLMLIIKIY